MEPLAFIHDRFKPPTLRPKLRILSVQDFGFIKEFAFVSLRFVPLGLGPNLGPKPRVTNIKGTNLKSLSLRLRPQDLCISVSGFTTQRWEVIVSRLGKGKIENQ